MVAALPVQTRPGKENTVTSKQGVYAEIGVRPVINALGNATVLGGSRLAPKILAAMEEANSQFVEMKELLEASGRFIAQMLGAEAAHVTPGCCAALALAAAACVAGKDRAKIERLPDTSGMKNEIIIQKRGRIKYDRCLTLAGVKVVEVGDESREGPGESARAHSRFTLPMGTDHDSTWTTPEQIESFIGPKTAAIHYLAQVDGMPGIVPLAEVVRIGKKHNIPVIVDAAGQVYPPQRMLEFGKMGVDLYCFGAKYFEAPNSTGLLVGRKDLVESAMMQSHVGFESTGDRTIGRAFKVDRHSVIAVVVALKEWFAMDHEARVHAIQKRVDFVEKGLQGVPGTKVTVTTYGRRTGPVPPIPGITVECKNAEAIAARLREGTPRIFVHVPPQGGSLVISVQNFVEGEEKVFVDRVRAALRE